MSLKIASESKLRPVVESREEKLSCNSPLLTESKKAVSLSLSCFRTILRKIRLPKVKDMLSLIPKDSVSFGRFSE